MSAVPRPEPEGRDELTAMTLIEHLSELRSRLIKSLVAVLVGATVMWFFYNPAFRWLSEQLQRTCSADQQCAIIQTNPLQGFSTRMTFSGYGGVVLAMPVILWQVWRFIMPGLYPKERRLAWPFTISAVLLFVMGAAVSLWTLPKALDFLIGVGGSNFAQFYTPDGYVSFTVKMMVAFGVGFEFPILLVFLQLANVVTPKQLSKWRRHAIVIIVVVVAVLTPSGDPISLTALALPMVIFYEGSILIGKLIYRRRRKLAQAGV
jgi:sec-independent protein translocase protein TatC